MTDKARLEAAQQILATVQEKRASAIAEVARLERAKTPDLLLSAVTSDNAKARHLEQLNDWLLKARQQ